ncbi:MAG: hypothetical protein Q4A78_12190 [Peptostreptococcaceae bacterium]|nr:hypothetical protein [Peptostreptococcaceae bacterium]
MKLSSKQELFVQEIIKGKSQREAYYIAYPKSKKWKVQNVDSRASNLLKNTKVLARYQELKEKSKDRALWNRGKAREKLLWCISLAEEDIKKNGVRNVNTTALVNAIKELNAMEAIGEEQNAKVQKIYAEIERIKADTDRLTTEEAENEISIQILRKGESGADHERD